MSIVRTLIDKSKVAARFLLWLVGFRRYQAEVPLFMIRKYVPKDAIVIEAGAHKGEDTGRLVEAFRPAKLYAFEPVPDLFKLLRASTRTLPEVECIPLALADIPGKSKLNVSSGYHEIPGNVKVAADGSSSLLRPTGHFELCPTVEFNQQIDVAVTTIDAFASEKRLPRIDFMWLDLQGMELNVLRGAISCLKTASSVYMEVSTRELYEGAPKYSEVERWMKANKFIPKYVAIPKDGHGNALFVRDDT